MLSKVFFVFFVLYLAVKLKYSKKFHCSLSHAVLSNRQGSILIFFNKFNDSKSRKARLNVESRVYWILSVAEFPPE